MPAFSVKKPLTIFVATLAVIVLGVVAYLKMTPDLLPNMDFPYVIVVTTDPGASPESIEEEISKPLEKAMAGLNGIKSVTSSSQNSVSMVMLEFEEGVNMDTVGVDVQQSISTVQGAWDDMVSAPYVLKINPSVLPVMVAAVSSDDMDIKELSDFLDETLEDKLTGISGVASVDASGAVKRQAHVILSQAKMEILADKIEKVINEQLDDAAKELYKARKEVTDAQKAIDEAEYSAIHGDLTIENIICLISGDFYIIDPNTGNIHESPNLDYAKLLQSLHGGYEFLMGQKELQINGSEVSFPYMRSGAYEYLYRYFDAWMSEHFPPEHIRSIYYHEIIHWLRLMPYKIEKDGRRAVLFYAGLIMAANDIIERFENNEDQACHV